MGFSDFLQYLGTSYIGVAVPLVFWIIALILVFFKTEDRSGRPVRFLLTGICLQIITNLVFPLRTFLSWNAYRAADIESALESVHWVGILINLIGVAGVILILYSFWLKFNEENNEKQLP